MGLTLIAAIVVGYALVQVVLTLLLRRTPLRFSSSAEPPSSLTLLVAIRNEASSLPQLIESLASQSLPLRVVWGDDESTDGSSAILEAAVKRYPEWKVVTLPPFQLGLLPGKQRVLAHLESYIQGEYFLLADGDMIFPPRWAEGLYHFLKETPTLGGACAPSLPIAHNWWAGFQRVEWASVLAQIAASQRLTDPPTAIGNSMILRCTAWASTGGWWALPPTLVEDYAMMKALQKQGWGFQWIFHPMVVGHTRAAPTFRAWLAQRYRWREALKSPPLYAVLYWSAQSAAAWAALSALSIGASWLIPLWALAEAMPIWRLRQILRLQAVLRYLPLLLAYRFVQILWIPLLYAPPQRIDWKGRSYATAFPYLRGMTQEHLKSLKERLGALRRFL